jgi:ribonuclease HI
MEIRAVVEALRVLPEGMHVWVSMDSAHVKKGIAEWLPGWVRDHSKVPDRTLWQKLLEMVGRHRKIEWSWVNSHSGIMLNECADMSATKGVMNEPPQGLVQYVVPVGEETDTQESEMKDG